MNAILEYFNRVYADLADTGQTDAPGGQEYDRVRREWEEAGRPVDDVEEFVRRHANLLSDGSESPEVLPRP